MIERDPESSSNRDCDYCGGHACMMGVKVPNTAAIWPRPKTFTLWLPVAKVIIFVCAACDRAVPYSYANDAFRRLSRDHAAAYNYETENKLNHAIDRLRGDTGNT